MSTSAADHPRPKVERDHEGEGVHNAIGEDRGLSGRQSEARVCGQRQGPDRDQVPREGRETFPDDVLVGPPVDEPGDDQSGRIAAEDLKDREQRRRDSLHGRIRAKEPRREAPEGQEQDSADEFRVAGRGGRRHEGPPRNRPGRGSRRGASPEVEGDDDDDGIDEDGWDRSPSEQEVGVGPGDDQADRSPHAAVREAQGLPDARGEVFGHAAERSASRLRLPRTGVGITRTRRSPATPAAAGARIRDLATLYKASISLVVLHIWLISTLVYKTIVFIIETVINIHKHTLSRDPVKAFKLIKDPDAFQLLGDETRRRIIYLLRAKEMTVSQIAGELNLTPQAIYHHIRKLRDAGMVEVAREERVDHFIETYYRATAEIFNMSHGSGSSGTYHEEMAGESLKALAKIGLTVREDPTMASRLVEVEKRMDQIGEKQTWAEAIAGLEDVDFFVKQGVDHLAKLLMMSDKEFNEYLNLIKEERKLLRSLTEAPGKAEVVARKT